MAATGVKRGGENAVEPSHAIRAAPDLAAVGGRPSVGPLVDRPRLLRRLVEASAPLVVLHAPAGYGKTALLSQWDDADGRDFTWLALDGPGADPAGVEDHVRHQLTRSARRRVLVLDGAHALGDPAFLTFVADVAQCQEPGSAIAIATRGEPPIPLGTLRVRHAVVELDQDELALTRTEAEAILNAAGLGLLPDALDAVCGRAAGWPAGIRLAALALSRQPDPSAAVARFDGDDRLVADYLREAVLADLAPEVHAFLRRVADLGELSGPLCDAVLERDGSAELLRTLARSERLVTAVDRGERRFRLHPLLAGMLAAELDRAEPLAGPRLHSRASAWNESEGDLAGALDHAIAARDTARAADLLWRLAPAYATRGRSRELRAWMDRVAASEAEREPGLALAAALERLGAGDRDDAERWADVAERALAPVTAAKPTSCHAGLAVIRAGLGRGDARRMLADAEAARDLAEEADARRSQATLADAPSHLAEGAGAWRSPASLLEGVAQRLLGERATARHALAAAARGDGSEPTTVRALALSILALLDLEDDDADGAQARIDAGLAGAAAIGLQDQPAAALVYAVAASTHARAGAVERAREDADRSRRLLAALPDPAPWYAAETSIALACALLRLSDSAKARELLGTATRLMRALPDATGLQTSLDAAWARADSFAIDAIAGPAALTIAELRVLRFLPSHLSFREIAARLHVSANTVKTQAHAVYRKLDASSRSEAVARAADIGLIDT